MWTGLCWIPTVPCGRARSRPCRVRPGPAFDRCSARAGAIAVPRPIARQLGIDAPLVCNSGAIIKDPANHRTLWRADFDSELAVDVLELFRTHDQPAVVFTDRGPDEADFIIAAYPTGRDDFDDYVGQNREHAEIDAKMDGRNSRSGRQMDSVEPGRDPLFHVCAIGTRSRDARVRGGRSASGLPVASRRSFSAVRAISGRCARSCAMTPANGPPSCTWRGSGGVEPAAICAVGDDVNDIPMIRNAGLGVAMGHARPEVREAADLVTGDHDEDGVAMLVDDVLLGSMSRR